MAASVPTPETALSSASARSDGAARPVDTGSTPAPLGRASTVAVASNREDPSFGLLATAGLPAAAADAGEKGSEKVAVAAEREYGKRENADDGRKVSDEKGDGKVA